MGRVSTLPSTRLLRAVTHLHVNNTNLRMHRVNNTSTKVGLHLTHSGIYFHGDSHPKPCPHSRALFEQHATRLLDYNCRYSKSKPGEHGRTTTLENNTAKVRETEVNTPGAVDIQNIFNSNFCRASLV